MGSLWWLFAVQSFGVGLERDDRDDSIDRKDRCPNRVRKSQRVRKGVRGSEQSKNKRQRRSQSEDEGAFCLDAYVLSVCQR